MVEDHGTTRVQTWVSSPTSFQQVKSSGTGIVVVEDLRKKQ